MTDAAVTVLESGPEQLVLGLSGEVDLDNVAHVEEALHRAIDNRTGAVTLDFAGLEYIDSAGLRCLFTLAHRLDLLQVGLDARVPARSPVRRAMELSGLDRALRLTVAGA